MRRVTVQSGGKLRHLGQQERETARLARANGDVLGPHDVNLDTSNLNDTPQAQAQTGLVGQTRLATPNGPTVLEALQPGDTLITADGSHATLQHILKTPVAKTAICIRAPYYGLDQDLLVGADHRIAVTSDAAEYLFGTETVLVPIWAIKDGLKALQWDLPPKTHLYQLQLNVAAALKIGNCAVESMPKSGQALGKLLSDDEARCFAAEHRSGYHN